MFHNGLHPDQTSDKFSCNWSTRPRKDTFHTDPHTMAVYRVEIDKHVSSWRIAQKPSGVNTLLTYVLVDIVVVVIVVLMKRSKRVSDGSSTIWFALHHSHLHLCCNWHCRPLYRHRHNNNSWLPVVRHKKVRTAQPARWHPSLPHDFTYISLALVVVIIVVIFFIEFALFALTPVFSVTWTKANACVNVSQYIKRLSRHFIFHIAINWSKRFVTFTTHPPSMHRHCNYHRSSCTPPCRPPCNTRRRLSQ